MNWKLSAYLSVGAFVLIAGAGVAPQSLRAAQGGARYKAPAEDVTLVGCIVPEKDWRKANRFAGNPIGVDNDFILVDASKSSASAAGDTAAVGTTGTNPSANTYQLNGKNEKQAKPFVGQRVEITGTLKSEEIGPNGPTGGPSASFTADLRLRELEVASIREHSGGAPCPSMSVK